MRSIAFSICLLGILGAPVTARLKPIPTRAANGGPGFRPTGSESADQFDATWQRLKEGLRYTTQKTGAFQIRYPFSTSVEFENWIDVPADYDPSRPWPLRVQLHGGVSRPSPNAVPPGQPKPTTLAPNRIAGESQISA